MKEDCPAKGRCDLSKVFAEHLPRLSILNLYLKFLTEVNDSVVITVTKNNSAISIQPFNLNLRFDGVLFENEGEIKPSMSNRSVLTFRLVTRPVESGVGSSQVEFMSNSGIPSNLFEDEGLNKMRKYFLHPPQEIVSEGVLLKIKCRNCQNILGSNIIFSKVRALPAGNWDEKANDFWYCHPPGGSCGQNGNSSTVDSVAKSLKAVKLADENSVTRNSIFDILNNPDPKTCLFSPCYWAVNKSVIPFCTLDNEPNCNKEKLKCGSCNSEVGMKFSENCYHIWDFGVVWTKSDDTDDINVACVEERAFDNFKRSIFSHIYELSYSPICQFIVKSCFNPRSSLFMWNSDRNLSVYETAVKSQFNHDIEVLPQQKVAKFLFSESDENNGEYKVQSSFEQNLIKDVEKDDSLVLLVPDTVLKFGKLYLQESSTFYETPSSSFQCGLVNF